MLELVDELLYQMQLSDWKAMYRVAVLSANFARIFGGKVEPSDLINDPPKRPREEEAELEAAKEAAKAKGIHVPGDG